MPANSHPDTPSGGTPLAPSTARDLRSAQLVGYGLFGLILALVVGLFQLTGATISSVTVKTVTSAGLSTAVRSLSDLYLFGSMLTGDQVLLLAVLVAGALGGCVHVATSFSDYVGNAQYRASWEWWYLLRPFIGGCLATAFYFLIRGGVMSMASGGGPEATVPNLHGIVAISFLVGMFSKQATDKLDDVFDTLFKSNKDDARSGGLESSVPVLNAVLPESVAAGSGDTVLKLAGSNFAAGAQVRVNGTDRAAGSVKPNLVEVTLTAAEVAVPARLTLAVVNPSGALSGELAFVVADRRATPGAPDDRGGSVAGTGAGEAQETTAGSSATLDTTNLTGTTAGTDGASDSAPSGQGDSVTGESEAGEESGERELVPVARQGTDVTPGVGDANGTQDPISGSGPGAS